MKVLTQVFKLFDWLVNWIQTTAYCGKFPLCQQASRKKEPHVKCMRVYRELSMIFHLKLLDWEYTTDILILLGISIQIDVLYNLFYICLQYLKFEFIWKS